MSRLLLAIPTLLAALYTTFTIVEAFQSYPYQKFSAIARKDVGEFPKSTALSSTESSTDKFMFLESLESKTTLNQQSQERTEYLNAMIENSKAVSCSKAKESWKAKPAIVNLLDSFTLLKAGSDNFGAKTSTTSSICIENPCREESFNAVASGKWKVIYAPHMTTIAGLFGGNFDVQYVLNDDGFITSHARYDFPIVGRGFLSASGTYSSVNDNVCRVDFDEVWVKILQSQQGSSTENGIEVEEPYRKLSQVPTSISKDIINRVGRLFFFEQVSVFPVSFLDNELIIFDFELLGTRICARKVV